MHTWQCMHRRLAQSTTALHTCIRAKVITHPELPGCHAQSAQVCVIPNSLVEAPQSICNIQQQCFWIYLLACTVQCGMLPLLGHQQSLLSLVACCGQYALQPSAIGLQQSCVLANRTKRAAHVYESRACAAWQQYCKVTAKGSNQPSACKICKRVETAF